MTDANPNNRENREHPVIDTSRHQAEYELEQDDMLDVAMLYNTVGKELTTVDKHAIDQARKATQLDESRVFNKQMTQPNTTQASPPQPSVPINPPPAHIPVAQQPPAAQLTHMQPVPAMISVDNSEIISKITAMEKKVDSLLNVYEKLLEKIAKGSRRMTLTINDKD